MVDLIIMSEGMEQRVKVVEVGLLEVLAHSTDEGTLSVCASDVLSWGSGVDQVTCTCVEMSNSFN